MSSIAMAMRLFKPREMLLFLGRLEMKLVKELMSFLRSVKMSRAFYVAEHG